MRECSKQLVEPVYDIMKASLREKMTVNWERANIVPIYNREDREKKTLNYRSVSLSSLVCKLCERIIIEKMD